MILFFLFISTFLLSASNNFDLTELRKQNDAYRTRIPSCEITGVPYFYTGNASFSGRACMAMMLSKLLDPEVVTPRDLNIKSAGFCDDPSQLGQLARTFGVDHYEWSGFSEADHEFPVFKSLIERGRPVLLEGFLAFDNTRFEENTNKILLIGFDDWGFIVHDPCGHWMGYAERNYNRGPGNGVFAGKHVLYLFESLKKLAFDGALISWSSAWNNHE